MPEWVKILISALVGASFGILSSISMEYVKPWISRRLPKRTIKKHLNDEFLGNLTAVDAAYKCLKEADGKSDMDKRHALNVAVFAIASIEDDRFRDSVGKTRHRFMKSIRTSNSARSTGLSKPLWHWFWKNSNSIAQKRILK
jgi:hypothetical protein